VRAGSPRLVSVDFIRDLCNIADQYCDGHLLSHPPGGQSSWRP
jgi:hypothetical protein